MENSLEMDMDRGLVEPPAAAWAGAAAVAVWSGAKGDEEGEGAAEWGFDATDAKLSFKFWIGPCSGEAGKKPLMPLVGGA